MKGSFEPRLRQIRRNWCNAWRLGEEHSRCIFQICTPNDACEHRFVCPATGVDLERHVMAALSVCANLFGCGRAKRGRARQLPADLLRRPTVLQQRRDDVGQFSFGGILSVRPLEPCRIVVGDLVYPG